MVTACSNGLEGFEASGVCCNIICGLCGGEGCSTVPGTSEIDVTVVTKVLFPRMFVCLSPPPPKKKDKRGGCNCGWSFLLLE